MRKWMRWFVSITVMLLLGVSLNSIFISSVWGQDPKPNLKATEPAPTPLPTLAVLLEVTSGNPTFTFGWEDKTPALAVIKSNEKWWIIFDESATVSPPDLKEHPIAGVKSMDIAPAKGEGVVFWVTVEPEMTPVINQINGLWQISFQRQPLKLPHQASIQLPKSNKDGLTIGLESPGKEVRFIDPHTGYTHIVFPSYRIGLGVAEEFLFPEFHVMATIQGAGIEVLKDDMMVTATSEQVTITHPEGLAITLPQDREQIRTRAMPVGLFIDAQDIDWVHRRQKINEELLDLPHSQHGPGELELAWLLLSNGQPSEALGYLTHLAQERPSITNLALFQILQGVSSLLLHRFDEATSHLLLAREEPEVQVWLSVIKAIQKPHYFAMNPTLLAQFHTQLQMIKTLLQSYPKPLRNQMASLILLAGIATQDTEVLTSILNQETRPENLREGEMFDLANARMLMNQNKPDAALQMLGELMEKAASPQVRAIARFDYVAYRWETRMMKKEDAFVELERIRSQYRDGWLGHEITAYLEKRQTEVTAVQ